MSSKIRSATVFACVLLLGATVAHAQSYAKLYSFAGGSTDGATPYAGLIQTIDGRFYGTTQNGGASDCGTVFVWDGATQPVILHSFVGTEGCWPTAGLLLANDGFFYGTTSRQGVYGGGSLFRFSPAGDVAILHHFDGSNALDGATPYFGLIQASDGLLYGTTTNGGAFGAGVAYRADLTGAITVLHSFGESASDGQYPTSPLIQAADGTFYGTTYGGGNPNPPDCDPCDRIPGGTVYQMTVTGNVGSIFNRFNFAVGEFSGDSPFGGLIQAGPTTFYGTTSSAEGLFGGSAQNGGTIFELDTSDDFYGLYTVYALPLDVTNSLGLMPIGTLLRAGDGNLYGTTAGGEVQGSSVLFRFRLDGSSQYDVLHVFDPQPGDGGFGTAGPLLEGFNGHLYGTTSGSFPFFGSPDDPGTLFRWEMDLSGVVKSGQTIAFGPIANRTVFDATDFVVTATASSGLRVSFVASGNCSVTGATVHVTSLGSCTITAFQAGNAYYNGASVVPRSFDITKAPATLMLGNLNQAFDGNPKSVTVTTTPAGLSGVSVTYNGSSTAPSAAGSYAVVASLNNDTYQAADATGTLVITNPVAALTQSVDPASVRGGKGATGTVTLMSPAPNGGAIVTLSSSNAAATVPATIMIPKGKTSKTFMITTVAVASATPVTISASYGGTTATASVTVTPPAVKSLTVTAQVKGGTPAVAKVTLTGPAPAGGMLVTLTSSNPAVAPSTNVTVPAGATSASVSIQTFSVSAQTTVTITATAGGVSASAARVVKK
jgi:uncharacterized repeat protein (TIGR03803 family)